MINKKEGNWNFENSNELDDIAYYYFIIDSKNHNFYELSEVPSQSYFMRWFKDGDHGKKFYKKAEHHLCKEIRRQKLIKLINM